MRRVFDAVLKESRNFLKECLNFIWSLCIAAAASAVIFIVGIASIIALLIFIDVAVRIIPDRKVVIDEAELQLIEKKQHCSRRKISK